LLCINLVTFRKVCYLILTYLIKSSLIANKIAISFCHNLSGFKLSVMHLGLCGSDKRGRILGNRINTDFKGVLKTCQAIKECSVCKKDLCSRHYETFSLSRLSSSNSAGTSLTYFFCWEHAEEFIDTLVKTLGDTRPVPYGGMAK